MVGRGASGAAGVGEITDGISRANISLQITPKNQYGASLASKTFPCGFGYLPLCARFDPSLIVRTVEDSLTHKLVPTIRNIQDAILLCLSGENRLIIVLAKPKHMELHTGHQNN